jgi:hypothetical protein
MYSELQKIMGSNVSLSGTNVSFDSGPLLPLEEQLEMYKELILNLSEGWNITGIYLDISDHDIIYDDKQTIRAMVVERDITGRSVFPNGKLIDLKLDGCNLSWARTTRGVAEFKFMIDRTMELGAHIVNASFLSSGGAYFNISGEFRVHKIGTLIGVHPGRVLIEPGETFRINITVLDTRSQFVEGNISVGGKNIPINGTIAVPLSFSDFGTHGIIVEFLGDEWYGSSRFELIVEVSAIPLLDLHLEKTVLFQGEDLNCTITLIKGSGILWAEFNEERMNWPKSGNGSSYQFTINTSELSIGAHHIQTGLGSDSNWVRTALGPRIVFTVLEPLPETEKPVDPSDDDDEPPDDDIDDDEVEGEWEGYRYLRIAGIIGLIILLIIIGALFISRVFLKRERPKIVVPRRKQTTETEEKEFSPDLEKAKDVLPIEKMDPKRVKVVASYLEVVDRAPRELQVKRSDTPRETKDKLIIQGVEKKAPSELVEGLEEALYKEGAPTAENVDKIIVSAKSIIDWYNTIPEEDMK